MGSLECVEVLIKFKANLNLYNRMHNTALHVAASNNNIDIIDLLMENKADVMLKNSVITLILIYIIYIGGKRL
jgi:ankyrin repeat protein